MEDRVEGLKKKQQQQKKTTHQSKNKKNLADNKSLICKLRR